MLKVKTPSGAGQAAVLGKGFEMHKSSLIRMEWFAETFLPRDDRRLKILDVGSYNVNGCYRDYFPQERFDYTGLDMQAGPNVDIVPRSLYNWTEIETDSFDVVISGQVFEHSEFFWLTAAEMTRVLKKDGYMCVIAPNGFLEHRYPVDCWRFFTDGMIAIARYLNLEVLHAHTNCAPSPEHADWYSKVKADAMLVARKPYAGKAQTVDPETYQCVPADQAAVRSGLIPFAEPVRRK